MLSSKLHSSIGNTDQLYVDDVFSAYTYTGNSSTQTINNGIDLAGKGGLVWLKARDLANPQMLYDTIRGGNQYLSTNATHAQIDKTPSITSWNQNGFSVAGNDGSISYPGYNYISWTFRKAPKFFDVVTYTGNGASNRSIAHSLGQEVGMVMTKATSTTGGWNTYHRSATGDLVLNTTAAQTGSKALGNSATTSTFTVSGAANTNAVTYVAYLFAHDTSADGLIQCGSATVPGGSGIVSVNLGWEPQFVLYKEAGISTWTILDTMRGWLGGEPSAPASKTLAPNTSAAESVGNVGSLSATGFSTYALNSGDMVYLAIRRPNKPPTTGTQVYNAIARTGTSAAATVTGVGFAPDAVIGMAKSVDGATYSMFADRLRGASKYLQGGVVSAEVNDAANSVTSFGVDGFSIGNGASFSWPNQSPHTYINWAFRRAPGFFDVVCYTGVGGASQVISHGLSAAPEMIILKKRNATGHWPVYHSGVPTPLVNNPNLNENVRYYANEFIRSTPSAAQFTVYALNDTGATYVAYLFASLPGISKVGSYTGNGSSQTINCGFSTGARFVLIKRTDSTGDWFVWDTVRGIVSANDPHLSLNTTAAEVTTNDSVDPDSTGFIVNQVVATNINVTSATYIFLAVS